MQYFIEAYHWLHGVCFIVLAVAHAWSWYRRGFWLPRYVHALASVAFVLGVAATCALPPPTNPDPLLRFIWPLLLPLLFTVTTYIVFVIVGGVEAAADNRGRKNLPR
jgi:peptidoglycan/LPS O-acetylase OafA/YrhL